MLQLALRLNMRNRGSGRGKDIEALGLKMLLILTMLSLTSTIMAAGEENAENMEAGVQCGAYTVCGANSLCVLTDGFEECVCRDGFYGSGFIGCTTEPQCVDDSQCADDEVCRENLCWDACTNSCPADTGCLARAHEAECLQDGDLWFNEQEE